MQTVEGLQYAAEGTGISQPLSENVNLLGLLLGKVISERDGEERLELVEQLRLLCKRSALEEDYSLHEEVQRAIADLNLDTIVRLLKSYTDFFHLVNQAEQLEIIRINRERAVAASKEEPREESIAQAIYLLKKAGTSYEDVVALLSKLDIQPTLTAHPTEARRRSTMYKQKRISEILAELQRGGLSYRERNTLLEEIHRQITLLRVTDEVRTERLTVQEEVDNGLFFLRNTIWNTIPAIYEDVADALRTYYGKAPDLSVFLRFRSWIGSDRDGNPNVKPDVTRTTALTHRRTALTLYLDELVELRRELSFSVQQVSIPQALLKSVEADASEYELPSHWQKAYLLEPYRQKISYMLLKIQNLIDLLPQTFDPRYASPFPYTSMAFLEDLELMQHSLASSGYANIARKGRLNDLIVKARAFGFHMASLDVRQHSKIHQEAVSDLLKYAGVCEDYAGCTEEEKLVILKTELANPRPLLPPNIDLPDVARELLDTLDVIQDIAANEPDAIGSYIISMTHDVSDLLEVMLLMKEVGLWRIHNGEVACGIDVVPLFETIEDLEEAADLMRSIFSDEMYKKQVQARSNFQEIMLGYSDSNKDGGFWMANWALYKGQNTLGKACRDAGVDFRLFHGRGGTVGRGGGRANQAILAMPEASHSGRIRFTEQGEVISFRYALPAIAHRHLEQIVHAMVLAMAPEAIPEDAAREPGPEEYQLMERIAKRSMKAYRDLIDAPGLWTWYTEITPIAQISRLPIASRPVSRKSADEVDFESLRAIPWGFAWTQTRYMIPGWYGIGAGLHDAIEQNAEDLALLNKAYQDWPFFRTVLKNAQLEIARSRFEIAQHYTHLASGNNLHFHNLIMKDYDKGKKKILEITGHQRIFEYSSVLLKSIDLRNPYTDVLNLLQIELLKRHRTAVTPDEQEQLRRAIFLSINGVAAAMQSTG